jgi:hypothetical protein
MSILSISFKSQNLLFFTVPETDFSLQLNEALQLYANYPAIESSIVADQDSHAKESDARPRQVLAESPPTFAY